MSEQMNEQTFCLCLGRELRRRREYVGMSRKDLESRSGIHRNSIARYEAGADIPIMIFIRLCVGIGTGCKSVLDQVFYKEAGETKNRLQEAESSVSLSLARELATFPPRQKARMRSGSGPSGQPSHRPAQVGPDRN